jgi:acyl transferase domain-containing protein/SAM-dependent methyltransferase
MCNLASDFASSMTVRTGCSAALVGLHEACRAIQRGDCTSAIVGGANLMMAPGMSSAMTEQGVLSPDGICKTFSADADGYGRGEAVSAIYIKPLDAALRDGNPIRAIIRSTATNSDGRTPGISMPSTDAHEAMIRQAYKFAGISDFSQTGFVECHGTGTPAGDPIETEAVARIFGGTEQGVYIGSVKPNIGHSEGASGLSSLIKVLLALEHRVIPPNIHFNDPNPNIPFKARNLKVPVEPTPWPEHGGDRASINSFGIGGSNAHVILESPRSYGIVPPVKSIVDKEAPQLLLYSANSTASLQSMIEAYGVYIDENPDKLQELSYTLATGREHLPYRAFSVASSDRHDASQIVKASPSPKLVFVFTGQGAQWPNMGKELLQSNAIFRDSIRSLDGYLRELLGNPKYNLEELISKPMKASQVGLAEISQPLCTAVQLALVGMLAAVNIKAVAVVGHSSGEIAAAYAAGALSAKEAIAIAWFRGTITQQQQKVGAMAAIGMGWNDVEPYLIEGVTVACENSPKSVTISGDRVKVEAVVKHITESPPSGQEVLARLLKVDKAYHSYHMAEIGADYCSLLSDHHVVGGDPRRIPFFSSVTGKLLGTDESLGPRYWQSNLESPVLFSTAVSKILKYPELKETNITFLEVGPHSALAGPLRQILAQASFTAPYVSTMARNQNCTESYLAAIGKLHQIGVPIDLKSLIPRGTQSYLPDLPRYAWDHEKSYWYESRVSKEWRFRKHQYHDLLGVRVAESAGLEPTWRNVFHLDNAPWIRDHKIGEDIVFPFAGYVAIAGEAIRQTTGIQESYALKHVLVNMALVITEGKPVELLTTFRPHRLTDSLDSSWWEFTVASHNGQMWTKHCTGLVRAFEENLGAADATRLLHLPRRLTTPKAYSLMQQAGLNYGPHFQGLSNIEAGTTDRKATAQVQTDQGDEHRYHLHPIVIDACLQLLSVAATKGYSQRHGMVVPTTIESLKIHRCGSGVQVAADADISRLGAIHGSALCVANGETVLQMSGARLSPMPGEDVSEGKDTHATARLEWGPHIDFMDVQNLVHIHPTSSSTTEGRATYLPALEELTGMCLMYTQRRLKQLEGVVPMPHMQTYRDWIDRQLQLPSAAIFGFQAMGDSELFEKAIALVFSLSGTPAEGAATAMSKILSTVTAMYAGRINPLEIFFQDDILTKVNALRDNAWDQTEFVAHLAHSRPNLRILELGAGTGATTSALLQNLTRPDGQVLYSTYTFSDPSPGLVTAAKARFKQSSNIQYATLDIGRDLEAQDFDAKDYDLIIATNVLHATPSLADSLKNVHKLLRPNGRLLLQELWTSSKWANFIFGILQSWWAGVAEGRIEEPYVDKTHWERALNASGLQLDTAVADSNIESLQLNNIMIAHRKEAQVPRKEITVLCFDSEGTVVKAVTQSLTKAGYKVNKRIFGEAMRADEDVLALLDQNGPFFRGIDQSRFEAFKNILNGLGSARLFWVTHLSQINCSDPSYAQILGVARTIRTEMGIDFATCEVDDHQASTDRIAELFAAFQAYEEDEAVKPDFEYAIVDGVVHVGRFHPFALESELVLSTPQDSIVLETEKPGSLVALKWSRRAPQPLDDKFVEIQTYAAGLNFKVRDSLIPTSGL